SSGPVTVSADHSLIGAADGARFSAGSANYRTGSRAAPLDPLLGPLADNGGPTPTHAPLPGSPLIDYGSNLAGLTADQRGDGYVQVLIPQKVTGTNLAPSGSGSYSDWITRANAWPAADVSVFDPALFATGPATITPAAPWPGISDSVAIIGPGSSLLSVRST